MENDELLSMLPEDLIHRILGFLTTKDAIKASFASKSMEALWLSSCPSLHFDYKDFIHDQDLNWYHKYVFNTMSRVSRNHRRIRSFKFQTGHLYDSKTLDNWIDIALDRHAVEILIGNVFGVPYCLPKRVLSTSSFLQSLALDWADCGDSVLSLPPLLGFCINLPCLQSLTLTCVSMNGESFQTLLKGCPSLEHLDITPIPDLLSNLNICHLKLKSIHVANRASLQNNSLHKVEVEAPCLEEFQYFTHEDETDVIIKTYKNLKRLCLRVHVRRSMEWLSALLSRCTSLETLDISLFYLLSSIFKIRSPYVKNISISTNRICLGDIEIDCPMLLSLRWICIGRTYGSRLLPPLSAINHHPDLEGHLHIHECSHAILKTEWFHKLRELLSTSRIAGLSLLCLEHSKKHFENGDNESLPTSAVEIGLLYLMVSSGLPESCYSFIMNGFLSTCHPHTIHLAPPQPEKGKESIHFIEFFREKLENWKDRNGCYCSSKIKCWKHQLKSVEIQEFSKLEDKEHHHYQFKNKGNLPVLSVTPKIRIKFQWN